MKKLLLLGALGLATAVAFAASPFVTKTQVAGPGSGTNYLIIPSWAGYQAIVQSIQYRNATNVGVLGIQSGAGAWTQTATNTSTGVTNQIRGRISHRLTHLIHLRDDAALGQIALNVVCGIVRRCSMCTGDAAEDEENSFQHNRLF